jgi:hypothetical protein
LVADYIEIANRLGVPPMSTTVLLCLDHIDDTVADC